jgi:hypothetical protein
MAIIYSYPKAKPILSDTVIGTHFDENGNPTKSFSISDIIDLAVTSLPPGPQGPTGPSGPIGPQGQTGSAGPAGPQGQQGIPGPIGPAGLNWQGAWSGSNSYLVDDAVGYNGASWFCINPTVPTITSPDMDPLNWALLASQGAPGPQGPVGATGSAGSTGSQGPSGSTGAQGIQGIAGSPGPTGAQGPAGVQGPIGPQGPQGAPGIQGTQGTQGIPGAVGPAGLNWRGQWVSGTIYEINDAVGYNGASYFCLAATNGITTPDLDTYYWALLASQGAEGPQGPQGPAGQTGPQGPAGNTGLIGPQGPAGPTGLTGPAGASGGITSINSLTSTLQNLKVGDIGDDFEVVSALDTHIFNLPDASYTARGVINTGPQNINGVKTFLLTPIAPTADLLANNNELATTAWVRQLPVNITLTTSGTSGAATLVGNTLNIPQYSGGSGIPWLESNATDLTVWNNGKSNLSGNTSFGEQALKSNNALGLYNTAYGFQALALNQGGSQNVAVGMQALVNVNGGSFNTGIGTGAARNTQTGSSNTAIGNNALNQNTGSNGNTAIGYAAGYYGQGANNVYIGFNSGPSALSTENNKLYISNTPGTPLIGGDFINKVVTIDGILVTSKFKVSSLNPPPPTSSSIGDTGEIRYSSDFIYVCVATNTWKRSALLSW